MNVGELRKLIDHFDDSDKVKYIGHGGQVFSPCMVVTDNQHSAILTDTPFDESYVGIVTGEYKLIPKEK